MSKEEKILFHIVKPDMLPVGIRYEALMDIDKFDNDSITHILLQDLLDYLPQDKILPVLELCMKKLTDKGHITIQGVDIKQLASSITFNEIDTKIATKILYTNKQSIHTMSDIISLMKALGYAIIIKKYVNIFEYYIEATK